jgi:hypothetical protein
MPWKNSSLTLNENRFEVEEMATEGIVTAT